MKHLLDRICDGLTRGAYPNERAVSTSIVVPILRELGWDDSDPEQVLPEHVTGRGRVDYALRCPPKSPVAFIEVKGVGRSSDADRQLFEYAFHEGVPLAILTDGREWNFYLPAQQGSYAERRVYQLVLDERSTEESIRRLRRYLQHSRLASGEALDAAIHDYKDARSRREATDTMPRAWQDLLSEADPLLTDALLERTEALCGFRPTLEQASAFLRSFAPNGVTTSRRAARSLPPAETIVSEVRDLAPTGKSYSWTVGGERGVSRTAIDAFAAYLDALFAAYPERGAQIIAAARTKSRNNLAAELVDVYPKQPGIAAKSHRRLANGLFLGTNLPNASKMQMARQVAKAAGATFGNDANLELFE